MSAPASAARNLVRAAIPLVSILFAQLLTAQQTVSLPTSDTRIAGAARTAFAVGSEEGEAWQMLSNVMQTAFDARGNLYILDAGNFRVTVLDPRGRLVRTIGKKGGGPGELMSPTGLAIARDGAIVVADLGRSAFSVFEPDGTFRFNVPFAQNLGMPGLASPTGSPGVLGNPSGGITVLGALNLRISTGERGAAPPPIAATIPVYTMQLLEKNAGTRVLYQIPRPQPKVTESGAANARVTRMSVKEFTPGSLWTTLPDGRVVVQHGTDYGIRVLDAAGKPQRILTRALKPRAPSRRDTEAARDLRAERMRSGSGMVRMSVQSGSGGTQTSLGAGRGSSEQEIAQALKEMEFAEVVPVTQRLIATPKGRIWVQRTAAVWGEEGPIDVLDPAGRYIGTLAPQPFPNAFSADGRAAYIERTEDGVEQVVVRQIPPAWL